MYISYNWLKNYLPTLEDIDIDLLAKKISGALAEVEQVIYKGSELKEIVIGQIKEVREHPTNKKLMLAKVDTKDAIRQIAFASLNREHVIPGKLYPVCLPGGVIYKASDDFGKQTTMLIEKKEIDNEISEGMLCSPKELGIMDEKSGVSIVSEDLMVGQNIVSMLQDKILEIENKSLTHRPDCFSHRGIAREISAIFNIEFLDTPQNINPVKIGDKPLTINVRENQLCKRFSGISIQNVSVKQSPTWMQVFLAYVGVRPINNIVDISNYVMLDIGYPLHMYDYDVIKDGKLIVRKANKGEKASTLNEKEYILDDEMMVVGTEKEVEDIAGIMGGSHSEISERTSNIIIESASWDMYNIRGTSMKLGLTTEASVRFSKGLSAHGTKDAVLKAVELVESLSGGEIASELVDIINQDLTPKIINFNPRLIKRLIGIDIKKDEFLSIFNSLGIKIQNDDEIKKRISDENVDIDIQLEIPGFRCDLNIPQDIIEEIARIHGYDKIDPQLPTRTIAPTKVNSDKRLIGIVKNALLESGLSDIYTYSFIGQEIYDKCNLDVNSMIKLKNPPAPELAFFRDNIIPSLLTKIELNLKYFKKVGMFEVSKVASKTFTEEGIPLQNRFISGILAQKNNDNNFLLLKAKVEHLFDKLHVDVKYVNLNRSNLNNKERLFHPVRSSVINFMGEKIGYIGEIHPLIKNNFGFDEKLSISAFDLDFEKIKLLVSGKDIVYKKILNTQPTNRDLNIWLSEKSEVGVIIENLNSKNIENLNEIKLVDIYEDKAGKKRATLRFLIQAEEKTLNDKEIGIVMEEVSKALEEMKVEIRS